MKQKESWEERTGDRSSGTRYQSQSLSTGKLFRSKSGLVAGDLATLSLMFKDLLEK